MCIIFDFSFDNDFIADLGLFRQNSHKRSYSHFNKMYFPFAVLLMVQLSLSLTLSLNLCLSLLRHPWIGFKFGESTFRRYVPNLFVLKFCISVFGFVLALTLRSLLTLVKTLSELFSFLFWNIFFWNTYFGETDTFTHLH